MALTRYRMGGSSQQSDRPSAGRWVNEIESGDAIATHCPADGLVVPVSAGDRLFDGNNGQWWDAMSHGGTMRWLRWLGVAAVEADGNISGASNMYNLPYPHLTGKLFVEGCYGAYLQTNATPASNNFRFRLYVPVAGTGTAIDDFDTSSMAVDEWVPINRAISYDVDMGAELAAGLADTTGGKYVVAISETGAQLGRCEFGYHMWECNS